LSGRDSTHIVSQQAFRKHNQNTHLLSTGDDVDEKWNFEKGLQLPMMNQNQQEMFLPINCKMLLSIREAAEYSNIGINKIDEMLKQPNCPFVLFVGTKKLVKRKAFEEFIEGKVAI
jgi:excisionase family DNA binding protein